MIQKENSAENYRKITLTQGQVALVDEEDYERISRHKWRASWSPFTRSYYARRAVPRSLSPEKQGSIHMHREIVGEV